MSFKNTAGAAIAPAKAQRRRRSILELEKGEEGILAEIDLPDDVSRRLMEMGFVPGQPVSRGCSAPGGDPSVFRVDGSEVALRSETSARLYIRHETDVV